MAAVNDADMKYQDHGEENRINEADNTADSLSVMFPPCQDPLLVKIYQGLPALPCVFLIFF